MNYACVVFVGGFAISGAWYYIWGRKNYSGPKVTEVTEELATRRASKTSATLHM